jgi:hypothetical protein
MIMRFLIFREVHDNLQFVREQHTNPNSYHNTPLRGSNMIHDLIGQKMVMPHPNRFWTLNCFIHSYWLCSNLGLQPNPLVSLWIWLFMHMWINENRACMLPWHSFYYRRDLKANVDSNLSRTRPLAGLRRLDSFPSSTPFYNYFMTLFNVPKQGNIIR